MQLCLETVFWPRSWFQVPHVFCALWYLWKQVLHYPELQVESLKPHFSVSIHRWKITRMEIDGITESLPPKKTFNIIKSNHQPDPLCGIHLNISLQGFFGKKKKKRQPNFLCFSDTGKDGLRLSPDRNLKAVNSLRRSPKKGREYLDCSWPMVI